MRVLLVEDNQPLGDAVRRGLAAEGIDVTVVEDGTEGMVVARTSAFDVLVLDIMLPGTNGYDICRSLRADGIDTPILMLSAKDGEYDIVDGLELGADDYLTKPFPFPVLVARVRALARRHCREPVDDVLAAGAIEVDPVRHRCTVDGDVVDLTPREFALLEALARNVGLPLTRSALLELVWGLDDADGSNVVDVYVGYLRRKLGDAARQIETVRGIGYRLAAR